MRSPSATLADLSNERLFERLSEPVKSEMVIPKLKDRNYWAEGTRDEETRGKMVDSIVDEVTEKFVAALGDFQALRVTANEKLGLLN